MNLTQLQTLPDENDEHLGGLLSDADLMLEISTLCVKYTPEQRIQAASYWTITGNINEVARKTNIPSSTIRWWKNRTVWWKELVRQIRKSKQDELDGMLTGILIKGAEQLAERIEHGNHRVHIGEDGQRTGYRVPLSSGELATGALAIPFDKRALLRGDPTSRTERGGNEETQALLSQLAKNFENFAKQVKPNYRSPDVLEGEFTEVLENAQEA
jgi:hypothetical protein